MVRICQHESRTTRVERDANTCYLYGIVVNNSDNHLNAIGVENNLLASDMAANSQTTEERQLLTLPVQPTGKCIAEMGPLFAGVQKPFISKCDMAGMNEGDCQKSVKFTQTLSKDAWSAIGAADWQAMKQYEAQKQKAARDAAAAANGRKPQQLPLSNKTEALARQQAEQRARDAYEKSLAATTVRYGPGMTQDELAQRLAVFLNRKAPDFQIDPALYADVVQETSRRIALCSGFTRADYDASAAPGGGTTGRIISTANFSIASHRRRR